MSGFTHVVTIGRNVGDEPMKGPRWRLFKLAIKSALMNHGVNIVSQPASDLSGQLGTWEGKVCEDSAVFVGLAEGAPLGLTERLQSLAVAFKQEAIGHIVVSGQAHLVRPAAVALAA